MIDQPYYRTYMISDDQNPKKKSWILSALESAMAAAEGRGCEPKDMDLIK